MAIFTKEELVEKIEQFIIDRDDIIQQAEELGSAVSSLFFEIEELLDEADIDPKDENHLILVHKFKSGLESDKEWIGSCRAQSYSEEIGDCFDNLLAGVESIDDGTTD
jgi:hypothetical protein